MPGKPIDPRTLEKIEFVRAALAANPGTTGLALRVAVKARFGSSVSARIVAALKTAADAGPEALAAWAYTGGGSLPAPVRRGPRTAGRIGGRRTADREGRALIDAAVSAAGALVLHLSDDGVITYACGGPQEARHVIEKLRTRGAGAGALRYFVARPVEPQ